MNFPSFHNARVMLQAGVYERGRNSSNTRLRSKEPIKCLKMLMTIKIKKKMINILGVMVKCRGRIRFLFLSFLKTEISVRNYFNAYTFILIQSYYRCDMGSLH